MEIDKVQQLVTLTNNRINRFFNYFNQIFNYIDNDYKGCKVGIEGEERVNRTLSIHKNIINLSNIRLEILDNNNEIHSIENDNILLTRNGIFVLEVKNFGQIGNYDIVIEKDGRWLRKNRYSKETSLLKNVTSQNNRHIGFLNKFINEATNRSFDDYIEVDGIIVIANEKVTIENYNENQNIFRDSELYSYIKSQPNKFTKEELDEIKKVIEENSLPAKKYMMYDYYLEMYENIKSFERFCKKYEETIKSLLDLSFKYNNQIEFYKSKLENDSFYCTECHNRVFQYQDKCNKCRCIDTINEEELNSIKESIRLEEEKIKKKNRIKTFIISIFSIIFIAITLKIYNSQILHLYDEVDGLSKFTLRNGLYGYQNSDGERVIEAKYKYLGEFSEELAVAETKKGLFGYINKHGEIVIEPQYKSADSFTERLALVEIEDGLFGYIDKFGEMVIGPMEGSGSSFNEGLARYCINGKYGFINTNGEVIVVPKYKDEDIGMQFSEGLVNVCIDGLWGYIGINGEIAIKPQFISATGFSNGLAIVEIPYQKVNLQAKCVK